MIYHAIQILILLIGVITIISVISSLFFAFDKGPKKLFTNNPIPEVGSEDFIRALSHTIDTPLEHGGHVEILNNGDGFFPALLEAMQAAKHSINFTVYIWENGQVSDRIVSVLTTKQREGVAVRVLLDGLGANGVSNEKFAELIAAGGQVERYRTLSFGKILRFHRRNHRRAIVIDGKVGFTGGMAVKDVWLGNARNPEEWRDLMFKVTGPMARGLQSAFTDLWTSVTGEIILGSEVYPDDLRVDGKTTPFIHLITSPSDSLLLQKFLLLPMMAAKHKLYITTPYFIPDTHLLETLKDRAKSGVDVRLILPNEHIDNKTARWNSQYFYYELLQSGVKIFEYQPTFIHSKYFVVDSQWSSIGSANLNYRSRNLDEENSFGISSPELAEKLESIFLNDQNLSKEITLKTWKKRSSLYKIFIYLSRIVEEQS